MTSGDVGTESLSFAENSFRVLTEISRGTMSTVYYCEGGVALKSMGEASNSEAVKIYQNDLKVLSELGKNPYIVRLHDTMDDAEITHATTGLSERVRNCQVLEALHGGELFYHIVRYGTFSKETARGFLRQLVDGVACIHRSGYIHRDLKPWNIILSNDHSQAKIIDFGLATPIEPRCRRSPWTRYLDGTRQYMAPENIVRPASDSTVPDLSEVDLTKVDTFALGVILINMLTGGFFFESCLSPEFTKLMTDFKYLCGQLRARAAPMPEEELVDLARLLTAMLHPDSDQRMSIAAL